MSHFRDFEKNIVRILAQSVLGTDVVDFVIDDAELVAYENSGVGYFLTVRHPRLPTNRIVLTEPSVSGTAGEVVGGYLVFVEDGELMLECYTAGSIDVPSDFRDREVTVTTSPAP